MKEFKISSSERLIVFFGCMNISYLKLNEIDKPFEEQMKIAIDTDRLEAIEIQRAMDKEDKEAIHELRVQIVNMLTDCLRFCGNPCLKGYYCAE